MNFWFVFRCYFNSKIIKKTQKNPKTRKNHFYQVLKMAKKALKKGKKHVFEHKKYRKIKIFLFEKQWLIKKFKKKIKNILVVWKNVVPLHPQSREVACETKQQKFERKIKYFFWNILVVQKNVVTLQSVSLRKMGVTPESSLKDWKQQNVV